MRLFTPLRPDPEALLPRVNPVAKLAAAASLLLVLFVSVDLVTPLIVLGGVLAAVPFSGLSPGLLLARTWPILLAAASVGLLNALFAGQQTGDVLVSVGPIELRAGSVTAGLALALRLLAIAGSGVLAVVTTDPTELADALQQQLRLSPRFAIGSLAAVRLLPMVTAEWQTLRLARRARGVSAGRSPAAAVRIGFGLLLSLLVGAVRRATRLALAMEARGFASRPCRSVARPREMRRLDWLFVAASVLLGITAIGTSLLLGSWRFLFG